MSLHGSIEEFPPSEVLHLLGASAKSGVLSVDGDRGVAELRLSQGRFSGGSLRGSVSGSATALVVGLLRFRTGRFEFVAATDGDGAATGSGGPLVGDLLTEATACIEELGDALDALPAADDHVRLVVSEGEPGMIDRAVWRTIVAIGGGCSGAELLTRLDQDEPLVARTLAALRASAMVAVTASAASVAADEPSSAPADTPGGARGSARASAAWVDAPAGDEPAGDGPAGDGPVSDAADDATASATMIEPARSADDEAEVLSPDLILEAEAESDSVSPFTTGSRSPQPPVIETKDTAAAQAAVEDAVVIDDAGAWELLGNERRGTRLFDFASYETEAETETAAEAADVSGPADEEWDPAGIWGAATAHTDPADILRHVQGLSPEAAAAIADALGGDTRGGGNGS